MRIKYIFFFFCCLLLAACGGQKQTGNVFNIMDFGAAKFEIEILNDHSIVHSMRELVPHAVQFIEEGQLL